jgi:hypothetical protein
MQIILKMFLIAAGHHWLTPVILAIQEAEVGGSWFEASQSK